MSEHDTHQRKGRHHVRRAEATREDGRDEAVCKRKGRWERQRGNGVDFRASRAVGEGEGRDGVKAKRISGRVGNLVPTSSCAKGQARRASRSPHEQSRERVPVDHRCLLNNDDLDNDDGSAL